MKTIHRKQALLPWSVGEWDPKEYGNHRIIIQSDHGDAMTIVEIPWRRRDRNPENKELILIHEKTGRVIANILPVECNREYCLLAFDSSPGPGTYNLYYLPNILTGSPYYPEAVYPARQFRGDPEWERSVQKKLRENKNDSPIYSLRKAEALGQQSVDEFNSFYPMEIIASSGETEDLLDETSADQFPVFGEDRKYPIRMKYDIPYRWTVEDCLQKFSGHADKGEYYVFQAGVFAQNYKLSNISIEYGDLTSDTGFRIRAEVFDCINLGGTGWEGKPFRSQVDIEHGQVQTLWIGTDIPQDIAPGRYTGRFILAAETERGIRKSPLEVNIEISSNVCVNRGDDEPWRLSRLRWLNSTRFEDESVPAPYTAIKREGSLLHCLGKTVELSGAGLPAQIRSFFGPEMTALLETPFNLLSAPVEFDALDSTGKTLLGTFEKPEFTKQSPGIVAWKSKSSTEAIEASLSASMEFEGTQEYRITLKALQSVETRDIFLTLPLSSAIADLTLGLGKKGGKLADQFEWHWAVEKNQDAIWIGTINGGLQLTLKAENYIRPLNTNFYQLKPLNMPPSWWNSGSGGIRGERTNTGYTLTAFSGAQRMEKGDVLNFDFRVMVTPFRTLDTDRHWNTRFLHAPYLVEEAKKTGANVVNIHHASKVNPWINYPFLTSDLMKEYTNEAHAQEIMVKYYYTVRELTTRAPELFALLSLGDEILSDGKGGGHNWLQEHVDDHYIAAWFAREIGDTSIITSGVSRWHNFYVEGMKWLVDHIGINGVYIDDLAFDRTIMKRVRKALDSGENRALIDLHSANQYNPKDGFANSANLYMEHLPFIDRMWFGEYFEYDAGPEYWMTEVSGLPFGLFSEMLQDGGHPWRGLLYGMTGRLPRVDSRILWKLWDDFGITGSRMIGYWVDYCPVKTTHPQIPATVYMKGDKVLITMASWADEPVQVVPQIDWNFLGLTAENCELEAVEIPEFNHIYDRENTGVNQGKPLFQERRLYAPGEPISVAAGKGAIVVLQNTK